MTTTSDTPAPTLYSGVVESPIGPLTVVASNAGIRAVLWPLEPAGRVKVDLDDEARSSALVEEAAAQLGRYFEGNLHRFDLPLDPVGTEFQLSVWFALSEIPYGSTSTYAEHARRVGRPGSARAVGSANGRNPLSIVLPCHRVIGADGSLTGFAGGLQAKRYLLALES
jgi:methylated-DNA-[protein]-cysteine S-methyltransferase